MTALTDNRHGIMLMVLTTFIFAVQDGISRHLAGQYNVFMVVMIRYWFFAAFVIAIAARRPGGVRRAAATTQPGLQIFRGLLLAGELCVAVLAFVLLGLVETHAIFAAYPLIVAALSGPVLGERVGPRRWAAVAVGFAGVVIILEPGARVFSPAAVVPLISALMFALYSLSTRYAARRDTAATSFFWVGVVGALAMTGPGLWAWEPMIASDWALMAVLSLTGVAGHFTLIKCYELAEAGSVQPFAYLQLVFASAIGISVFGEALRLNAALGSALVVAAGLFTLQRERRRARRA